MERELAVLPPVAMAYAAALAPRVRVDLLLDSVTLAHLGIVLSLTSSVGFGVAAACDSAAWGWAAAVIVVCTWCVVCKVGIVRHRVVRLMRWLATP